MEFNHYCPEWLDIIKTHEETLRAESLSAKDCMKLGGIIARIAEEKFQKSVAIRIITNGQVTFSFLMEGTSNYNNWWMDKKLNTCRMSGVSSIRTLVEVAEGLRPMEPEFEIANNFALCGGCFPLKNAAGKIIAYVLTSGLPHECDHQLIADSLSEFLGKEVPSILA